MEHRARLLPCLAAFVVSLASPTTPKAFAAWSHDAGVNIPVTQPLSATNPTMDSDGAGGLFVAWSDSRNGNLDIFLQHFAADGSVATGWPAAGFPVCTQTSAQTNPSVVSDGSGGIYVAWQDSRVSNADRDIYVTRVLGSGALASGWPLNGLSVSTFPGKDETSVRLASDGSGGVVAVWSLIYGSGDTDVFWARVTAAAGIVFSGSLDSRVNYQVFPVVTTDGVGNLLVAYQNNDANGTAGSYFVNVMRVNPGGATLFGPVSIVPAAAYGYMPMLVSDGAGGGYVAYPAPSGSVNNLEVQHLSASGTAATGWGPSARNLVSNLSTVYQDYGFATSDGAGGLVVAWSDQRNGTGNWDAFAIRILPGGSRPGGWPLQGLPLSTGSGSQTVFGIVPDGVGGAVVMWNDQRDWSDVYAGRLTGAGVRPPGWGVNGNPVFTGATVSPPCAAISDGHGGALMAMQVSRGTSSLSAQNIDGFGQLGDMRPTMGGVRDVAADQGGQVRLTWGASWLDQTASPGISEYWIWCQTPQSIAQSEVRIARARWVSPGEGTPVTGQHLFRKADDASAQYAWQFVAALPTNGSSQYSDVVATVTDSMAEHNPPTVFMVEARGASAGTFWDSAPDSGYSVDNLAPASPSPFTGQFSAGTESLHWGSVSAPDLVGYRLYRGTTSTFVPGPSNLVVAQPDTGYTVSGASAGDYYKLSAVDVHGNESPYAMLAPTVDVEPRALPAVVALAAVRPDPASGPVSLRFELPRSMRVTIAVHDVQGRQVAVISQGTWPAGTHDVGWDGRASGGRTIASGLYYVVLTADREQRVRRFVRL